MARVEITYPGTVITDEFTALVAQPTTPATAKPVDVGLVEISTPTELIPGPPGHPGPPGPGVSVSDTPPASPVDGDLWWESDTGILWAWYEDADSGQWVQISGGTGSKSSVIVADSAPAGAENGQLWWNSATGNLYCWYEDADSGQWVQVNTVGGGHVTPQQFGAKGDGVTNDTVAFNAALAVTGDIYVPSGVYLVNELTIPSNTRLSGARGKSIIRARAGTVGPLLTAVANATGVTIADLTLDCAGLATRAYFVETGTAKNHQIIGCHVTNSAESSIYFRTVEGLTVANCIIDNAGTVTTGSGIVLTTTATNFSIYGNVVNNPSGAGIVFSIGSYGSIHGNVVVGGGPSGDGITGYHDQSRFVSIIGNTLRDSENHGMHVGGQHIVIANNIVENATLNEGIYLGAYQNGSVSSGVKTISSNCIVTGNTVLNAARSGILCDLVEDSVISNNRCKTSLIQGAQFKQCHRNVITGNLLTDSTGSGMLFLGSQDNDITGNRTGNSGGDAYRFAADGAVNTTGNNITANRSVSDNRGFIEATGGDFNIFSDNRVTASVTGQNFSRVGASSIFDNQPLEGNAIYDPVSLAVGAGTTATTISVPGAALGDLVVASFAINLSDVLIYAWVSAADTVSVRFYNLSAGVRDLSGGNIRVRVTKHTG